MSVQRCSSCDTPYWRYRGDFPPKGYCSGTCYEARKSRKTSAPEPPEAALKMLMAHLLTVHGCTSVLQWFDCPECDRLEAMYANALDYPSDRLTREMVQELRA